MDDKPKLTHEEHHARAMLMGMRYHHGNGFPFYYKMERDGPAVDSMLDANTLEPIIDPDNKDDRHVGRYIGELITETLVRKMGTGDWRG